MSINLCNIYNIHAIGHGDGEIIELRLAGGGAVGVLDQSCEVLRILAVLVEDSEGACEGDGRLA